MDQEEEIALEVVATENLTKDLNAKQESTQRLVKTGVGGVFTRVWQTD